MEKDRIRAQIKVSGAVQGVGYRPFVYRLAHEHGIAGWVANSAQGVLMEVEADEERINAFIEAIRNEKPPLARVNEVHISYINPTGESTFAIQKSGGHGTKTALILPDMATCADCRKEIFDPNDRRYLYPFTNCTNCGPRFTIIKSLPYDRPNTSMGQFMMCDRCKTEYENPLDRRFHAQPNACPDCGPQLTLWDKDGKILAERYQAMSQAVQAIRSGQIVAIKGLGGFHLVADARNDAAIDELRKRKRRKEKPLALMCPNLESAKSICAISRDEEALLLSPECPIVLLKKSGTISVCQQIAPNNPYLGVMLPYTPLHHILMKELDFPIVATSGNVSDEPICTDEHDALYRLKGLADLFLVHDRPIVRHVDDSIVRMVMSRPLILRRSRGFAPYPIRLTRPIGPTVAVGAHQKNTVALSNGNDVFISQHIGDLNTAQAEHAFDQAIGDLSSLYDFESAGVACDLHPDYRSTQKANSLSKDTIHVQHHFAHVMSCMADNGLSGDVLGVAWDGTGYGDDMTIWGGEFLKTDGNAYERVAHLRTFRLPGGEQAVKEPRRSALGLLHEIYGKTMVEIDEIPTIHAFSDEELKVTEEMLEKGLNSPVTSSAGRLFDAVASIIGLRQKIDFEGQAAMMLEFMAENDDTDTHYPFEITGGIVDWEPTVREIIVDRSNNEPLDTISKKFHNTLTEIIVAVAKRVGTKQIVLTGGCFQNSVLTERTIRRLWEEGFNPYWHCNVPPNDGGICLGQIMAANRPKD